MAELKATKFFGTGGAPPIDIINKYTSGATQTSAGIVVQTQKILSTGALTADTYATILEITSGPGIIQSLAFRTDDATSRIITPKITIDGTVVFEQASSAITTNGVGVVVVGSIGSGIYLLDTGNMPWRESFKVEFKSSLSETAKTYMIYTYYLT